MGNTLLTPMCVHNCLCMRRKDTWNNEYYVYYKRIHLQINRVNTTAVARGAACDIVE
jgi:hypothetical protein